MYFKKIEMIGFKSFADRTVIEFDRGFTAIVGPNGCGKSNVSDAIRWVLGEKSAKSLRGDNMQDVIFKGTERRKSLSYCEVSLTFDNTDRFFNISYDELCITRKLYRSGESEYLINKNTCRLKDIENLLFNSGIGKNGYSVVGQGQVEKIFNEKPEERRAMFEEAAGTAKFKARKDEAERKLASTRDNLQRVDDIVAEIDRQMGPLKKQAEDAKKYLQFKGELKDLEINAFVFQHDNSSEVKKQIGSKLTALSEELSARQADLDSLSNEYSSNMDKLTDFDKQVSSINDEILRLTVELEKQEGETKVTRERINFTQKENDRLNLDISNAQAMIATCTESEAEKTEEKTVLEQKLSALNQSYEELSNRHLKIVDEMSASETETGASQQKIIETLGSLSDIKSDATRLATEKNLIIQNQENLTRNLAEISIKIENVEKLKKNCGEEISSVKEKFEKIKNEAEGLSGRILVTSRDISDLETEKANLVTQLKVFENRKKLLTEMQAEFEGYAYSVKKLLKEREKNADVRNKMVGVLASLIKVPAKYETAIEVALGASVQNIVTFDENGAKDLIAFLKANQFGRATFLPITTMRPRTMDERTIAGRKGVFGVASKLISYDKKIENVVSNLLGGTVIVDTLATAVDLARDNRFSFKIVTLEGDVVSTQGSLTGGSKKSEAVNLISRQREIETLADEIEEMTLRNVEITRKIDFLKVDLNGSRSNEKQLEAQRGELEIKLAQNEEKMRAIENDLEELSSEKSACEMEQKTCENKLKLIESDLSDATTMQNALSGNKEDADMLIKKRQEHYNQIRAERDEIVANMTTVKVEIASCEEKLKTLTDEIERLKIERDRQNSNIETLKLHLAENEKFIASAEDLIREQIENAKPSAAKNRLQELQRERVNIENSKIAINAKIKEIDQQKTSTLEEITRVNDRKLREENNLSRVDTELEASKERIYEEYSLTYDGCLEFKRPDFDIKEASVEINRLKKEISALGYVNVHAIEDVSTLLDRYNQMTTQAEDLKKAETDLVKIIADLSAEMLDKFNDQFNKINESFKVVFRELFGGGNARLELTEAEDPLEAGVEIMVQLPGKAANKLSLLSGGEKTLTAIALLFSIMRLKPLPFSLFDEIEAALDDANIERFAMYLKRLSSSTQFIVITHRKPTMELADNLYGVTMQEKGVSKVVSVKLSDAIKQLEEEENEIKA